MSETLRRLERQLDRATFVRERLGLQPDALQTELLQTHVRHGI